MKSIEEKSGIDVTFKIKLENLEKLHQISLLVQLYTDNKKILQYLKKIAVCQEKRLKSSRLFVTEKEFAKIVVLASDTIKVIKKLLASKTVEDFVKARENLEEHLQQLDNFLIPSFAATTHTLKSVFEKAKSKVKSIKDMALDGLGYLKKNMQEDVDEECESV